MSTLERARHFVARGLFLDARHILESERRELNSEFQALRAESLERTGALHDGRVAAERVLRSRGVEPQWRSACELVLGRTELELGNRPAALEHLQRALASAAESRDLSAICWAQIAFVMMVGDGANRDAVTPILSELKQNVIKVGSPELMAALHVFVGQLEGKRGAFASAHHHTRLAEEILRTHPNCWLEAVAQNTRLAIAFLRADAAAGFGYAQKAIELADRCGVVAVRHASYGNVGNLLYLTGKFGEALSRLEDALSIMTPGSDSYAAALDAIARVHLAQGNCAQSEAFLDQIRRHTNSIHDRAAYVYRHSELTRIALLKKTGNYVAAAEALEPVLQLAAATDDQSLRVEALLCKSELLARRGDTNAAFDLLDELPSTIANSPLDVYGRYELTVAASAGGGRSGEAHILRAKRIFENLPSVAEQLRATELSAYLEARTCLVREESSARHIAAVESVAALLLHAGRPELLAHELVQLIADIGIARRATATARDPNGAVETLAALDCRGDRPAAAPQCFELGTARERHIAVVVEPYGDVVSRLALQAIRIVLATVRDLEVARAEREERVTLWPIDDIPLESGHAVVNGGMRDLIALAKKVAPANVAVLLTGESGTGKEVVARAIHSFSPRARQPFIPFNCAAVPREMLESQLFGHRRGAFTGADRDQPGVIRAAAGGTLFLDEIGEMGPDLQPKLLRFLESGEICPLGESTPFTVDVRIVAATNANIEDAVKAGRFREDLFYRLNVVRLRIPPLRERRDEIPALAHHFLSRAAEEFRKGQLRLSEETMEHLVLYPWPGNIRELNNEIRRMAALAEPDSVLQPGDMAETIRATIDSAARPLDPKTDIVVRVTEKLPAAVERIERAMIAAALERHGGRVDAAAKALGLSRKGLYLKRQRYGL